MTEHPTGKALEPHDIARQMIAHLDECNHIGKFSSIGEDYIRIVCTALIAHPPATPKGEEGCPKCWDTGYVEMVGGGIWTGKNITTSRTLCDCPCGDDARDQENGVGMHATQPAGAKDIVAVAPNCSEIADRPQLHLCACGLPPNNSSPKDCGQEGVTQAALNQNDAMRQELSNVGNLVSDLARAMGVDQANDDGTWPDLAGRIHNLTAIACLNSQPSRVEALEEAAKIADGVVNAVVEVGDGDFIPFYKEPCREIARTIAAAIRALQTKGG